MTGRPHSRVFAMKFANVYPLYVQKASARTARAKKSTS